MLGIIERSETCRVYRATIPLSSPLISDIYTVPARLYESSNGQNRMCELRMFSQIQSHISSAVPSRLEKERVRLCAKRAQESPVVKEHTQQGVEYAL